MTFLEIICPQLVNVAETEMSTSEYVKPKFSTCNYLLIMRKTYEAEIKTEVKIERTVAQLTAGATLQTDLSLPRQGP